jgi:hypothetical protein
MKKFVLVAVHCMLMSFTGVCQTIGVGTSTPNPNTLLHIDLTGSVTKGFLVTGLSMAGGAVPNLGSGTRLMFFPGKGAFRAGTASGTGWDDVNVGLHSTALGVATIANGQSSTAFGFSTEASALYATSFGHYSKASGTNSTAIGSNTLASGQGSTALGNNTIASGSYSTALGHSGTASGIVSTAMGLNTSAQGAHSIAAGNNTVSKGFASTVIGTFNDSILTTEQNSPTSTTPLFIVGNGNTSVDRSNAMVVRKDGNVGIGTNAPRNPLSFPSVLGKKISLYPGATGDVGFAVQGNQLQIYGDHAGTSVKLGYDQNGTFTSNFEVYGNGNGWLRGTLQQNSDARLKTDITPISGALQQLQLINGYQYSWKDKQLDRSVQTGVLAQEIQNVFPQLVKEDATGTLSVNYAGLIPYLIEAAKELQNENEALKKMDDQKNKKTDQLQALLQQQQKDINDLKLQVAELLKEKIPK